MKTNGWIACLVLALLVTGGLAPNASATAYTWDSNPATVPIDNAGGTWSTINTNWDLSGSKYAWPNSYDDAIIGTPAGTIISVSGSVNVSNITFTGAYSSDYYRLHVPGDITLADGATINAPSGQAYIETPLHGGAITFGNGTSTCFYYIPSGGNDYSGLTTIKAGSTVYGKMGSTAAGTVVESGAAFFPYGALAEPLTLNGNGVGGNGAITGQGTCNGLITLGSAARIYATASPNLQFQQITGNNFDLTFGGSYRIIAYNTISTGSGKVIYEGTGASAFIQLRGANTFTGGLLFKGNNAGAYVSVENTTALGPAASATVTFGPGAQGFINLAASPTIVGLNTDATPGTPVIKNDGTARTLTVNNATSNTFAGSLQDGTAALSLIKGAAGTLTLSGDNSYTGSKTINGGMLVAAHSNALGTAGTITVNTNGTLGIAAGVTLTRAVTFNSGSGLAIDFTADGSAGKLVAGSLLDLSTGTHTLVLRGTIKAGSYVVASATSVSGTFTTVDTSGLSSAVTVSYPGDGTVVVTALPKGTTVVVQ